MGLGIWDMGYLQQVSSVSPRVPFMPPSCFQVFLSPCIHVSMSVYLLDLILSFCVYHHASAMSLCLRVSVSKSLGHPHVPMLLLCRDVSPPCFVSMSPCMSPCMFPCLVPCLVPCLCGSIIPSSYIPSPSSLLLYPLFISLLSCPLLSSLLPLFSSQIC